MKKTVLSCTLLVFVGISALFAFSPREFIPSDHWIYDGCIILASETGNASMAISSPLTVTELYVYFKEIDYDLLSSVGKTLYDKISVWFNNTGINNKKENPVFSFGINPSSEPTLMYRSSNDTEPYITYRDIGSILLLPLSISISDFVFMELDAEVTLRPRVLEASNTYVNIPFSSYAIDQTLARSPYMNIGGSFWNLSIERGPRTIGRTQTGSVILSDSMDRAFPTTLSFFSPKIKYEANVTELKYQKYLYYHQLSLKCGKRIVVKMLEGIMINEAFELRYLNPVELFHGQYAWNSYGKLDSNVGSMMGLSVEINPYKNMRLYGLFQMNEFQLPSEDQFNPNSYAAQCGLEAFIPFNNGYITFGAEYVYTTPFCYRLRNANWSFFMERSGFAGNAEVLQWTGSHFGPDTVAGFFTVGYNNVGNWKVSLLYQLAAKGEYSETSMLEYNEETGVWNNYPNESNPSGAKLTSPSGIPAFNNTFGVQCWWQINDWFSINGFIGETIITNFKHESGRIGSMFECVLSCKLQVPNRINLLKS